MLLKKKHTHRKKKNLIIFYLRVHFSIFFILRYFHSCFKTQSLCYEKKKLFKNPQNLKFLKNYSCGKVLSWKIFFSLFNKKKTLKKNMKKHKNKRGNISGCI